MNFASLSNEELSQSLRSLQQPVGDFANATSGELDSLAQDLQVHRLELEMQNRALRDSVNQTEAAVRRYSDLYDHLPIGLVTLTRTGRIVQANLTAAGWLRRDRSALVGGYLTWFLDAFDAGRFAGHLETCVQTNSEQTMDVTLRLKDGLLLAVQLTSRPAPPEDDGEAYVHTAITNISKLNQVNAVVADIERERKAYTDAVSNLGGPAPLTVSKFAQDLLQQHAPDLSTEVKNTLERMECAAVRMEATFQDLLDFCCLGHDELALDPVNLEELVQQITMEQRTAIKRRRAEIAIERPLPCVRGSHLLLGQVLANVINHMLRHGESGPRIRIGAEQREREIVVKIAGGHTPPDTHLDQRSFRTFERRHERDSFWRNGLGLAVVRRTIERMNGRVWVDSAPGTDICVNIGLPAA